MKAYLAAAAATLALAMAAPASAADMAARPYTKAPPPVAAIYDWTGFYIGANGGWGSADTDWTLVGVGPEGGHHASGGTVGGQIGYRWQSGQFVFGVEGQGNWADFSGSHVGAISGFTNNTKIDSFGLITGQVGYAWNNVLLYVKGGAAVVGTNYDASFGGVSLASANDTRWGGTVGAGLEFGFAPNWSVGAEYNHIFLGGNDRNLTGPAGVLAVNVKQDVDMGLVRLNYKFGGPMLGRY